MKLSELIEFEEIICEEVYVDEHGNVLVDEHGNEIQELDEAAKRAYKRIGQEIKRQFRCVSGPKQGMIVATPDACSKRKQPIKVRTGKRVAITKKDVRIRKTKISKKKAISKLVTKLNDRLDK